ncbi:hypothetical protein HN858_04415 [Candidatus Falkowbacteria bacterium]|jgi:hypothetical protein|nr:hypothetical protein [Candidatus Falkowbacteria bacterium]MBT5503830.1 hypothetical protein [Candidatus Falkowbacteria bacterium]MBT6574378.1 hypothetical protein [Candidatus Falkowbacteria bacterium]MBT7348889.1 hypothetical protein [Candidatus Falkowbacteria bacterium]MBT7501040.1 hypothetical protein [Candidatus Falkowbacteria bacterium]
MKKIILTICLLLVLLLGILIIVYAGIDDSPGGQMIGVILIVFSIVYSIKLIKK